MSTSTSHLGFDSLKQLDYGRLPPQRRYITRNQSSLPYRVYGEGLPCVLVLVHGSAGSDKYFVELGHGLASGGIEVVTLDLRGHGDRPERRGDVDHVGQCEEDLHDLILHLRQSRPDARFLLGGHSLGGGFVLRYMSGRHRDDVSGSLLLAPMLGPRAPTTRPNAGGWTRVRMARLIALNILSRLGVRVGQQAEVIRFNLPKGAPPDMTPTYSFRLLMSLVPADYRRSLSGLASRGELLIGAQDAFLDPQAYAPCVGAHTQLMPVTMVPGTDHFGLVTQSQGIAAARAACWRLMAQGVS